MELGITNKHDKITNIPRENQGVGVKTMYLHTTFFWGEMESSKMSDKLFGVSGTLHAFEVAEGVLHGSRTYLLQSPDGHLSGLLS